MISPTMPGSHSLAAKYQPVPDSIDTRGQDHDLPVFPEAIPGQLAGKNVLIISVDGPKLPEIDCARKWAVY